MSGTLLFGGSSVTDVPLRVSYSEVDQVPQQETENRIAGGPGPLHASNLPFVEDLYWRYASDPLSVDEEWRAYFRQLTHELPPCPPAPPPPTRSGAPAPPADGMQAVLQERVDRLVDEYRVRGHLAADVDPLEGPPDPPVELDPGFHGFNSSDMKRKFHCSAFGREALPLEVIIGKLRETYCRSIGVEYMHIGDGLAREWLRQRMESVQNHIRLERDAQIRILTELTDATIFETFVRKKFIGAKTFSLEGAEGLIPLLHTVVELAGADGIDEIVMAMAHRGRLSVLANVLGKRPADIFREFQEPDERDVVLRQRGRGDVSYHLGHSTDRMTSAGRRVHLSLCFNPSHLEFVDPVALGRVRAKQDRAGDKERTRALAVLIHGDAAFAGEGIVQETLNLSDLEAYRTGGALHVIVNNGIGFTTPPSQYTSSHYVTGVARMLQVPVFHVKGEDPEAVEQVVRLAMDFRRAFARDAVIDMHCYRRLGHNESDEPSFTQPLLYRKIRQKTGVREGYVASLVALGGVSESEADQIVRHRREELEAAYAESGTEESPAEGLNLRGVWEGYAGGPAPGSEVPTAVGLERLQTLLRKQTELPAGFVPNPKIQKGMEQRLEMADLNRPLDWAAAESLAFASLAVEGFRIRMSGQDTERGTFGHRHAVLHDARSGDAWLPLAHLAPGQAPVEIANSPLSEAGVLGFEYGYSLDCPEGLVLWEAQFGDFVNAAQVIVDQFIASAEDKWNRLSGIVLLLPHGYEGRGPEHSSARPERFLTLTAEDNIQVASPSTPAQYFHLLRRQALRRWKKPLVVFTPKSLLRSHHSASPMEDCARGSFQPVIPDSREAGAPTRRVLLASGKLAVELETERASRNQDTVAIVRIEEFYPFPYGALRNALAPWSKGTPILWVQEEPINMGAWCYMSSKFRTEALGGRTLSGFLARDESASPATGSRAAHKAEQAEIISRALEAEHEPTGG